ncbi:MAG: helix-turn-helix transcriptional regulator [Prevotella sp.]|nr:helix-turn-helix transcriptional regulator [Prevotella sp.]
MSCKRSAWDPSLKQHEIISLYQQVLTAANASPDSALLMIDSLRQTGTVSDYHTDLMRAKIYAQSLDYLWLDSAIIIGERLITLDVAKKDLGYRQDILEMLVNACRLHGDDEQTIRWSTKLLDLVRQQGLETEALRTEAEIGMVLSQIGKADDGMGKIDNVIRQLSGRRKWAEMDASIIALKRKVSVLDLERRYSDIPPVAQMMLDLLADYEQHPDEFHDDSYREVTEEQRPGYIEFYRAKAYLYMAHAYAQISEERGAKSEESAAAARKAGQYLALYEQTDFAKTMNGREETVPTWRMLGQYDKMEAACADLEAILRQQGDTVNTRMAATLYERALAAKTQGRYAESAGLYGQYETLSKTLNERLLRGKAHLYAARYHAQEQQQEIDRQRAYKQYAVMVASLIGLLAMLGLFFAWYAVRQWRRTQMKNRVLARQIKDAILYKEMYEESERAKSAADDMGVPNSALHKMQPEELFRYIEHEVSRRLLFLNPLFDRQMIMDEFHLSKESVGAAFAQGSKYKSLPQFVTDLRLEYASRLLVTTDLSISDIMAKAGFSNASVFSRYFSRKYQISPTQYRRANSTQQ